MIWDVGHPQVFQVYNMFKNNPSSINPDIFSGLWVLSLTILTLQYEITFIVIVLLIADKYLYRKDKYRMVTR